MDLQPYGLIEEALQKSIIPETASPKISYSFFAGVLATLLAGGIIYWIISENKSKNKNNRYENQSEDPHTSLA